MGSATATNSTFGPLVIPLRSAATAPLGGGSLASSEVINTCAAKEGVGANKATAKAAASKPARALPAIIPPSLEASQINSTNPAIADDGIGRPKQGMSIGEFGLAVAAEIPGAIDQRHHRLPERFAAGQFRILRLPLEQIGDKLARRLRMNRPVGHQQSTCAR